MAKRRDFLNGLLASALWPRPSQANPAATAASAEAPDFFLETLSAVADAIVPRDRDPGAVDAGVPDGIAQALAQDTAGLALYREGLGLLESRARASGATSFAALDAEARGRVLASLAGRAGERESVAARFYARVRADVLARYWASEIGQRAVGYDPPIRGYPPSPGQP